MPITERDFVLLNSYIDNRLAPGERAAFESRLAADSELRAERDSLLATIGLLRQAERMRVPRNFTLDPRQFAQPARRSFWGQFELSALTPLVGAGAALAVMMICGGGFLMALGLGAPFARLAAAPAAPQEGADTMMVAEATEAPAEAAPEMPFAAEAATSTPVSAAEAPPPLATPAAAPEVGGAGGGPQGGAPSPPSTMFVAPTAVSSPTDGSRYGGSPTAGNVTADQGVGQSQPSDKAGGEQGTEVMESQPAPESAAPIAPQLASEAQASPFPVLPFVGGGLALAGFSLLVAVLLRRRA